MTTWICSYIRGSVCIRWPIKNMDKSKGSSAAYSKHKEQINKPTHSSKEHRINVSMSMSILNTSMVSTWYPVDIIVREWNDYWLGGINVVFFTFNDLGNIKKTKQTNKKGIMYILDNTLGAGVVPGHCSLSFHTIQVTYFGMALTPGLPQGGPSLNPGMVAF